jgi:hypothetical protein
MNFLDVARCLGGDPLNANPEVIAAFMKREFRPGGGGFNYNTSIVSLPNLFRGAMTVEEAIEYCSSHGAPAGWKPNSEAIEIAGAYAVTQQSSCYRIQFSAVPIGRLPGNLTAYMGIKAPLVRVRQGKAYVVVPGFRLGHRPVGIEIDVAASLALATFGRDDFAEADYEYLDCSRGSSGERELSIHQGRDRRIFNLDEVDHMLNIYMQGLALALASGMTANKPNFRGYRVIDPDQPHMI